MPLDDQLVYGNRSSPNPPSMRKATVPFFLPVTSFAGPVFQIKAQLSGHLFLPFPPLFRYFPFIGQNSPFPLFSTHPFRSRKTGATFTWVFFVSCFFKKLSVPPPPPGYLPLSRRNERMINDYPLPPSEFSHSKRPTTPCFSRFSAPGLLSQPPDFSSVPTPRLSSSTVEVFFFFFCPLRLAPVSPTRRFSPLFFPPPLLLPLFFDVFG